MKLVEPTPIKLRKDFDVMEVVMIDESTKAGGAVISFFCLPLSFPLMVRRGVAAAMGN